MGYDYTLGELLKEKENNPDLVVTWECPVCGHQYVCSKEAGLAEVQPYCIGDKAFHSTPLRITSMERYLEKFGHDRYHEPWLMERKYEA